MVVGEERPWESIPREAVPALRPELAALTDEIVTAIEGMPDFEPLDGTFADFRQGVERALWQFAEMVDRPGTELGADWSFYVELGRTQGRAGRPLDTLLSAYRLGARVAWRRLAAAGEAAHLEPRTLYVLAEAIFAYIDELSAATMEGYAREQVAAAGEHQRRRRRLVGLLVADPPAPVAVVEAAAAEAHWALPARLAAIAVAGENADRVTRRVEPDVLVSPRPPVTCVLLPDPDGPGRRAKLQSALQGDLAALGPATDWRGARRSFARAQAALRLAEDGVLPGDRVLVAEDHAVDVLLHGDAELARELAGSALLPLAALSGHKRAALSDTLRAWLRHRGRVEEAAGALHCHPQTVRYRLGRLRELFGDALDDPDARFELELALRLQGGSAATLAPPA